MMKKFFLLTILLLLCGCNNEIQYSCTKGILEDNKCKIIDSIEPSYQCPSGYEENKEGKCVNTITIQAKQVSTCPEGYEIGSDNWCYSIERKEKEVKKTCVSNNIKEDDKLSSTYVKEEICYEKICTKTSEDKKECLEFKENKIDFLEEKVCEKGWSSVRGECVKKSWMKKDISCELGTLKDGKCIIKDEKKKEAVCLDGYSLNNNMCEKITYEVAEMK